MLINIKHGKVLNKIIKNMVLTVVQSYLEGP